MAPPAPSPESLIEGIQKSLVTIIVRPRQPICGAKVPLSHPGDKLHVVGLILVRKRDFICIVANSRDFERQTGEGQKISVVLSTKEARSRGSFFTNQEIGIQNKEIRLLGDIVLISIKFNYKELNISKYKEIQLYEEPLRRFQEVHLYTDAYDLLTPGHVISGANDESSQFQHNCRVTRDSEFGGPVVASNGYLAGISYAYQNNYTTATSVRAIAMAIEEDEKRVFTSVRDMLQHLRSK